MSALSWQPLEMCHKMDRTQVLGLPKLKLTSNLVILSCFPVIQTDEWLIHLLMSSFIAKSFAIQTKKYQEDIYMHSEAAKAIQSLEKRA